MTHLLLFSAHSLKLILYMQHFGQSPLPAYEPAFDWENERSMIFGQRVPETPISQYGRSKILLLSRISSLPHWAVPGVY